MQWVEGTCLTVKMLFASENLENIKNSVDSQKSLSYTSLCKQDNLTYMFIRNSNNKNLLERGNIGDIKSIRHN